MVDLLTRLAEWKKLERGKQIVFLGGDVHIGGRSLLLHDGKYFGYQLISSAITNSHLVNWMGQFAKIYLLKTLAKKHKYIYQSIGNGFQFAHHLFHNTRNYGVVAIDWDDSSHGEEMAWKRSLPSQKICPEQLASGEHESVRMEYWGVLKTVENGEAREIVTIQEVNAPAKIAVELVLQENK